MIVLGETITEARPAPASNGLVQRAVEALRVLASGGTVSPPFLSISETEVDYGNARYLEPRTAAVLEHAFEKLHERQAMDAESLQAIKGCLGQAAGQPVRA